MNMTRLYFRGSLMVVFTMLILCQSQWSSATTPNAMEAESNKDIWNTYQAIGKFLYNDPPKPDQIFLIKYKITNGTILNFTANQGDFISKVSSNGTGIFELKIPRNYPYTNYKGVVGGDRLPLLFFNGSQVSYSNVTMDDCFFDYVIPFSGHQKIDLADTYLISNFAYHGDAVPDHCISETTVIPEFPFASVILLISIMTIIIVGYKIKYDTIK